MISRTRTGTWTGLPAAVALAALLAPGAGAGQERESRPPVPAGGLGPGMVLDGAGGWRAPTPADALRALRGDPEVVPHLNGDLGAPAVAVLRQELESRPAAELDGLANALADIILASAPEYMTEEDWVQQDAFSALSAAARASGRGTPHPGSFAALVSIYETIAAEALAGGGTDPVAELERRKLHGSRRLWWALASIFGADQAGRGADYLLAVLAASEPPKLEDWPRPRHTLWCDAAYFLRGTGIPPEENPRRAELPEAALDDEAFYQLCGLH